MLSDFFYLTSKTYPKKSLRWILKLICKYFRAENFYDEFSSITFTRYIQELFLCKSKKLIFRIIEKNSQNIFEKFIKTVCYIDSILRWQWEKNNNYHYHLPIITKFLFIIKNYGSYRTILPNIWCFDGKYNYISFWFLIYLLSICFERPSASDFFHNFAFYSAISILFLLFFSSIFLRILFADLLLD